MCVGHLFKRYKNNIGGVLILVLVIVVINTVFNFIGAIFLFVNYG
jgi:hypothetical protein